VTALVVTADDFGAAIEVNEAVEKGHIEGILTAASLMVGAPAAEDAVARALRLPRLGVGLHLVLTDGVPTLPAVVIPDLVDAQGRFAEDMGRLAWKLAVSARTRRQCRAEIEAQFAAFVATGLPFDHVNAHKHFHVHPIIGAMVVDAARRHGVRALRAPTEPGLPRRTAWLSAPFALALRRRARKAGLLAPEHVFGLANSGHMSGEYLASTIASLNVDLAEIYLHPAMTDDFPGHNPGYGHRLELAGLTSVECRAAVRRFDVRLTNFAGTYAAPGT
jgi:hopanoid biosynthesis associated protein HpnK